MSAVLYSFLDKGVLFTGNVFGNNFDGIDFSKQIIATSKEEKIKLTLNLDMALDKVLDAVWPRFKTYVRNNRLILVGLSMETVAGLVCLVLKSDITWDTKPVHHLGKGPFATEFALSDWKQIEMFARVEEVANKERLVEILI